MRVYPTPWGNIQLTNTEVKIINTLGTGASIRAKMSVILALKQFKNADKVYRVLELDGGIKRSQGCYTLYPVISRIGERTPEQYIADVEKAVARFNAGYREYIRRFESAKGSKERTAAVIWWDGFMGGKENLDTDEAPKQLGLWDAA
jgi:hypothetical protein